MAAMPELRLQVAFENDPDADPPAYSDMSDRLRLPMGITARRGRQYELDVGQPGTAGMVTLNDDGALTPGQATSPWWPHVAAGRKVRLAAVWEGIEYPLATTFADSFGSGWPDRFAARNMTALNGTDLWKRLSRHRFASQLAEVSLEIAGSDIIGYLPLSEPAGSSSVGDISTGLDNILTLRRFRFEGETSFGSVEFGSSLELFGADGEGAILLTPATFLSGRYLIGPLDRDIPLSGEFSVSAWLTQNRTIAGPGESDHMISIHLGSTTGINNLICLLDSLIAPNFTLLLGQLEASHSSQLADGQLHHVVATVEDNGGLNRTLRLYVDGVLSDTSPTQNPNPVPTDSPLISIGAGNIGTSEFNDFPNGFWDGLVSDVMVVGRRLTDAEVAQIYQAGVDGLPAESVGSRITRILDLAGTAAAGIDSGTLTAGGQKLAGRSATEVLNELGTLDGGLVDVDPQGQVEFHSSRNSRRRVPPAFTLDAAAGEVQGLDFSDDDTLLVNDMTFTGSTGATGRVTDQASIDRYTRFRGQNDIPLATDSAAAQRARRLVRDYGQTRPRTQSIEIDLVANPHLFHALLAAQLSDRFDTIGLPPNAPAPSMPWLIEQLEHRITEQSWVVAIQASPYDTQIRAEDIMDVFTSSGTWTKPSGLTFVRVRCQAAGGGGGGAAGGADIGQGACGGGGEYTESIIAAADLGATETVTVGAAGTGGAAGDNAGSTGGNSSFGTHLVANGGSGGSGSHNTGGSSIRAGGRGGSGGTGQILIAGGDGTNSRLISGTIDAEGTGGGAHMGGGARYPDSVAAGLAPVAGFGGGGSGARASTTSQAGGNGAGGTAIVENYYWHPEGS